MATKNAAASILRSTLPSIAVTDLAELWDIGMPRLGEYIKTGRLTCCLLLHDVVVELPVPPSWPPPSWPRNQRPERVTLDGHYRLPVKWAAAMLPGGMGTGYGVDLVREEPDKTIHVHRFPSMRDLRVMRDEADRFEREVLAPGRSPDVEPSIAERSRHKERCRAIAEVRWAQNPMIGVNEMATCDEITRYGCEVGERDGHLYHEQVVERWIRDLAPPEARKPGPKPKAKS